MNLDEAYWTSKYQQDFLGWDTGTITTPLKEYIDQVEDKCLKILVPGCGNGHEVKYLHDEGFTDVTVIDLSPEPFKSLIPLCPNYDEKNFILGDFFNHSGQYDLIIEQTFFCALEPKLRQTYADKMNSLLVLGGRLVGVFFQVALGINNPPFGGGREEYREYFKDYFDFIVFEDCYNSIKPRAGAELFINLRKK